MMNKGMLWYDNNLKAPLSQRILEAFQYYRQKYGHAPTFCLIHPTLLKTEPDLTVLPISIRIKSAPYVLPNHFWLGVEEVN